MRALLALLALGLAACAAQERTVLRPAACDAELSAFSAVARLAEAHGQTRPLYDPALEALRDQILDCVEERYPTDVAL
jgi:hypothetical protein